jgi:hypothetical protein
MITICGGADSIPAGNGDSSPDNGADDHGHANDPDPDLCPDPNLAVGNQVFAMVNNRMTVRIVTMNRMTAIAHLDNTCFSPSFLLIWMTICVYSGC